VLRRTEEKGLATPGVMAVHDLAIAVVSQVALAEVIHCNMEGE
jgi:hypothetical protein